MLRKKAQAMNTVKKSTFARFADPNIKTAARMFGYTLTNPDWTSVLQLAVIFQKSLQPGQRKFAAVGSLLALTDAEYEAVLNFMEGE